MSELYPFYNASKSGLTANPQSERFNFFLSNINVKMLMFLSNVKRERLNPIVEVEGGGFRVIFRVILGIRTRIFRLSDNRSHLSVPIPHHNYLSIKKSLVISLSCRDIDHQHHEISWWSSDIRNNGEFLESARTLRAFKIEITYGRRSARGEIGVHVTLFSVNYAMGKFTGWSR